VDCRAHRSARFSASSRVSATRTTDRSGFPLSSRLTHAIQCGPRASLWIRYVPEGVAIAVRNLPDLAGFRENRPVFGRFALRAPRPSHRIGFEGVPEVTLTCPNCGNDRNFLVKTLQMHVVNVEGGRVEVSEESRPAVLEVLCDECESALNFEEFEDTLRKEVLLTIGAR
jgi:hypothetical protein